MALTEAKIRKLLTEFIGSREPSILAKVKDVNELECTCTLDDDGSDLFNVRLRPITGENIGIVEVPEVGSFALAIKIEGSDSWMVVACSKVKKIKWLCNEISINGGNNGGLVISQKVIDELKTVIDRSNEIITALTNIASTFTASGSAPLTGTTAGSAITGALAGLTTPLSLPLATNLENANFKH